MGWKSTITGKRWRKSKRDGIIVPCYFDFSLLFSSYSVQLDLKPQCLENLKSVSEVLQSTCIHLGTSRSFHSGRWGWRFKETISLTYDNNHCLKVSYCLQLNRQPFTGEKKKSLPPPTPKYSWQRTERDDFGLCFTRLVCDIMQRLSFSKETRWGLRAFCTGFDIASKMRKKQTDSIMKWITRSIVQLYSHLCVLFEQFWI